jgi:hypothetical protein
MQGPETGDNCGLHVHARDISPSGKCMTCLSNEIVIPKDNSRMELKILYVPLLVPHLQ